MSTILAMFSGGWGWLAAICTLAITMVAAWFGGKKIGTVQTQAKADVKAAEKDAAIVKASSNAQLKVTKEVADVQENVSRIGDNDVDEQLRNNWKRP